MGLIDDLLAPAVASITSRVKSSGTNYKLQNTSTLLILYNQDDDITSDALTRDMHPQLTRCQMTDPR